MNRKAFSLIRFKAVEDGEERFIEGMATTPTPDRVGDIVDPMGAEFADQIPLHLHHDSTLPVGRVKLGRPTRKGIPFKAYLPKVLEAGTVRDRVDEAWHSLKYNLISAVSIGFRVLKDAGDYAIEFIEETGGLKYLKTEIIELSLVSIPAQPEAVITGIKSLDNELRAALGQSTQERSGRVRKTASVVAIGESKLKVNEMKNLQEMLTNYRASLLAKQTAMDAILAKAADEGRTLDEEEDQKYKDLEAESETLQKHVERLEKAEARNVSKAKPVRASAAESSDDAGDDRAPRVTIVERKLEPGIEFARYVMCIAAAKGNLMQAEVIAHKHFKDSPRVGVVLKSAVAAGTTTDTTWASSLLEYTTFLGDFIEFLRPQTILGKFGTGGIPSLRRVPFNIHINRHTTGGAGYWVGQGRAKPLTKFDFDAVYLGFAKVAGIAVITEELLRFSNPSAELLVRDGLRDAVVERIDTDFVDPDKAVSANVSPASITNGVSPIPSSGDDADAIREDVKTAMQVFINAKVPLTSGVWIMNPSTALSLSLMRNALGQKEFPDVNMNGGTFEGLPVIVSEYVSEDSGGADVVLVSAQDIYLADDGVVTIDVSREASLQMDDAPSTHRSDTGVGTSVVSMFQTNSVAIRAERYINWSKRRSQAAQIITDVNWGATS